MPLFASIFAKLIPLYFMIVLGFLAAKNLHVQKESVARLVIYIIAPVVVFYGAYTSPLDFAHLSLPLLFFAIGSFLAILFLAVGTWAYGRDPTRNILAFAAGTGNTGYFGIPASLALFGDRALSPAVLCILGVILFENSVGFYITAKGKHTARESLMKLLQLPSLYAFFAGLLFHRIGIPLGDIVINTVGYFKGAYTILGMMIVGMGLSTVTLRHIDFKFIGLTHVAKFIVWPILMLGIVRFDQNISDSYDPITRNVLIVMGLVPLAANTVAFASEFGLHPDKAAVAVIVSTLIALFYLPWMAGIWAIP